MIEHEIKTILNNDAHDPKLNMLKENVEGGKQVLKAISNQLEIGKISVPKIKEGEVIVHGRIIDENGNGKGNYEVSIVVEGESLSVIGKSDESGYYSIVLPLSVVKKMEGKDFDIYIRFKGSLIDKSAHPIKFIGPEIKYEKVIEKSELKNVRTQEKVKRESRKIGKRR